MLIITVIIANGINMTHITLTEFVHFCIRRYCMGFEKASAALANFTSLHQQLRDAADAESARLAEKSMADAALVLATTEKDAADAAAETALAELLAALAEVGVVPPAPPVA